LPVSWIVCYVTSIIPIQAMNVTGSVIRETEVSISNFEKDLKDETDPAEKAEWREQIAGEKETLKELWNERIDNWKNTFRKDGAETGYGIVIYEEFGHKFRMPTKSQFKDLLSALDEQHPGWDEGSRIETIGSSFFRTLESNFPELKKSPKKKASKQSRKGSSGCLVVVAIAITAITLWFTL